MKPAKVEAEALALSAEERAALAQKLLLSLEDVSEEEFDRLWGEEAARRAAELDSGKVKAVPGSVVAKKARALLR
jgi:putative addiction module component (TIGR02574 family)